MNWPRGKYNRQRIVGFEVKLVVDVLDWGLKWPRPDLGSCGRLGPLRFWISPAYEQPDIYGEVPFQ